MTRFTTEFGMGSGGSTSLLSPGITGFNKTGLKDSLEDQLSLISYRLSCRSLQASTAIDRIFNCVPYKLFSFALKRLGRYMVKPHEQLVLVSSTPYNAYTPSLSTSWSRTAL